MQLTYDELTDTLYVYFSQEPVARTEAVNDQVVVDYDDRGGVRGVEILNASDGLAGAEGELPRSDDLARVMQKARDLPVYA